MLLRSGMQCCREEGRPKLTRYCGYLPRSGRAFGVGRGDFASRTGAIPQIKRAASAAALDMKCGQTAPWIARGLDRLQVAGRHLAAALVAFQLVSDLLALIQAPEAGALDRGDVDKDVLVPVFRLNETITFLG